MSYVERIASIEIGPIGAIFGFYFSGKSRDQTVPCHRALFQQTAVDRLIERVAAMDSSPSSRDSDFQHRSEAHLA